MPSDYQPLDLSALCNVGADVYRLSSFATELPAGYQPLVGPQVLRGLPFRIGESEVCLVGLGGDAPFTREAVTVPIGAAAHTVVVAHALLDSQRHAGEAPGCVVAEYVFHYQDGQSARVSIRERFEIGVVPELWGEVAFAAVPDRADSKMPRYQGPWSQTGERQTEAEQGRPTSLYLWAWHNPDPARPLASLVFEPRDRRLVVAAVTVGHVDEDPLALPDSRVVHITLPQAEDATRPFAPGLGVTVDRGTATFPYPVTPLSDAMMADPLKGWGEPTATASSPTYVEVAAIPSATVTVRHGDETLGQATWRDLEEQGKVVTPRVQLEIVEHGRNWVFTTVVDDATGQPIPCRVHFRSPHGIPYQPHGHHSHVFSHLDTWHIDIGGDLRLGQLSYAYIDGRCQGWLPTGDVIVDVARGFEYEPLRTRVTIQPGQRELMLRLRRMVDMNREGYYSGDSHVHFLSTQGSHTEAAGEDLNVVNLLQSQWGHLFTNTEEWTGQPSVSRDGRTIVYASQENRQHLLGHLTLLGLKSPVMPWCSDGPDEAELGGNLETTLSHWADACHAQSGTVVIPHLPEPNGEPAALIATGRADAVEMLTFKPFHHLEYYRYLNGGYRLPLVGGTDKMSSDVPVGLYRTYVYLPPDQEFSYDNWLRALRGGNTFLSGGPLLRLTVDGQPVGSTLRLARDGGTVEVEAVADSIFPIHTLQIVEQGRVVAATEETHGARRLILKARLTVGGDTWLAARCSGPAYTAMPHHDVWRRGVFAHTSPVYVACGGEYDLVHPDTLHYMLTLIDGSLTHIRRRVPATPRLPVTHHHGEADHLAFLERPFHEARAALHRRLHKLGLPH